MTDRQVDPTPEPPSEELQAERNLRASCLDMAEAEVERLKAEHAAQIASLTAERDFLKRGVATVTFGDADATIAKLVAERDAAQQEAHILRVALVALVNDWTVEELDDANGQPHACAWQRAAVREACATDLAALLMLHSSTSTTDK